MEQLVALDQVHVHLWAWNNLFQNDKAESKMRQKTTAEETNQWETVGLFENSSNVVAIATVAMIYVSKAAVAMASVDMTSVA